MAKGCSIPIKKQLKANGVKIGECARFLNISRPTFDHYVQQYENNGRLNSDCYQVAFDRLFKGNKIQTPTQFRQQLEDIHYELVNELLVVQTAGTPLEGNALLEPDSRQLKIMQVQGKIVQCMNEAKPVPVKWIIKYNELLSGDLLGVK